MAKEFKPGALRRRIAPSFPITLQLPEEDGSIVPQTFRLAFDFNAFARIEEVTGYSVLNGDVWKHLSSDKVLSVMFWAALLAHQPEYDSPTGLTTVRYLMDPGNADQIVEALIDAYILPLSGEKRAPFLEIKAQLKGADRPTQGPGAAAPAL